MKNIKKFVAITILCIMLFALTGCNKDMFDTVYTYDRAIIKLPNGDAVEGKVTNWTDYEDGDQIQVKINGKTYLVHSMNVTLIAE